MELIYRGQRYQKKTVDAKSCNIDFLAIYRGVHYRITNKCPSPNSTSNPVQLTYRGVSYTKFSNSSSKVSLSPSQSPLPLSELSLSALE